MVAVFRQITRKPVMPFETGGKESAEFYEPGNLQFMVVFHGRSGIEACCTIPYWHYLRHNGKIVDWDFHATSLDDFVKQVGSLVGPQTGQVTPRTWTYDENWEGPKRLYSSFGPIDVSLYWENDSNDLENMSGRWFLSIGELDVCVSIAGIDDEATAIREADNYLDGTYAKKVIVWGD